MQADFVKLKFYKTVFYIVQLLSASFTPSILSSVCYDWNLKHKSGFELWHVWSSKDLPKCFWTMVKQSGSFQALKIWGVYLQCPRFPIFNTSCAFITFLDWVFSFTRPSSKQFYFLKRINGLLSPLIFAEYMASSLERCWKNSEVIIPMWIMPSLQPTVAVLLQLPVIVLLRCYLISYI
jgi:hypothetical protein